MFLITPLNSPAYISVPVRNTAIVDRFLESADKALVGLARSEKQELSDDVTTDFYKLNLPNVPECRCGVAKYGPAKLKFFWARIGDTLHVATRREILEELAELEKQRVTAGKAAAKNPQPTGHAMLRIRGQNWQRTLPSFRLGWEEQNRIACLKNVGPLSHAARALRAAEMPVTDPKLTTLMQRRADLLRDAHGYCPDGGHYHVAADGTHVHCSLHGSPAAPKQENAPVTGSTVGDLLQRFQDLTISLDFREEGLRAEVIVQRSVPKNPGH